MAAAVVLATLLATGAAGADRPTLTWSPATWSPDPLSWADLDPLEQRALAACGAGEVGLRTLARAIASRMSGGERLPDVATLDWEERASGEPHPWPRVWTITGRQQEPARAATLVGDWLRGSHYGDLRRCGVADGPAPGGGRVIVVVAVDALADLAPIPRSVRVGEWIAVEAQLRVPTRNPKVLVIGPDGAPRTLLSSIQGALVRARFAPDRRGMFMVQVVGDVAGGSRPLAEATLFADAVLPTSSGDESAPGEQMDGGVANESEGLAVMVNAARAASGRSPLERSGVLDEAARQHAMRMSSAHELAHNVGDGDPTERLAAIGVAGVEVGENVARASGVAMAHRQIWNSPSHRANVLSDRFHRAGFAVVRDNHGEAWVVEEFAAR